MPKDVYFGLVKKSRGSLGYVERQNETLEGMINFNHTFWDALDVNAVVGMGRYIDKGNGMTVSYQNANDMIHCRNPGIEYIKWDSNCGIHLHGSQYLNNNI